MIIGDLMSEALQKLMLSWRAHHTDDLWINPHQPHALRCAIKLEVITLMQYHNMQMSSIPTSESQ